MNIEVENQHSYVHQLFSQPDAVGVPLSSEDVTADLGELIDETFTAGVLAEQFPAEPGTIRVNVRPLYLREPAIRQVEIELVAENTGQPRSYCQQYAAGPWIRSAQQKVLELREAGTLAQDQMAYRLLVTLERTSRESLPPPLLQPPPIEETTLEACGVRGLGEGSLVPDRPVLINARLAVDAIRRCEEAGLQETGGAVLGRIVRLPQPLPGTETRIVTILSSLVEDHRHVGTATAFSFSPQGLAEAAQICDVRGLGESVLTVFHTHGWSAGCRNCDSGERCSLAVASPSLLDYEMLSLFPSKGTLMPIAGRKPGVQGEHPVLQLHAWRGGQLQAIDWQQYHD
jgi:hypothetical protein